MIIIIYFQQNTNSSWTSFLGRIHWGTRGCACFCIRELKTLPYGVGVLAEEAELSPQAAFAAHSKSLQFQWSYLQRVVPNCESCFEILPNALNNIFWPALFQGTVSDSEKQLFSLPARHGGLKMRDPLSTVLSIFLQKFKKMYSSYS